MGLMWPEFPGRIVCRGGRYGVAVDELRGTGCCQTRYCGRSVRGAWRWAHCGSELWARWRSSPTARRSAWAAGQQRIVLACLALRANSVVAIRFPGRSRLGRPPARAAGPATAGVRGEPAAPARTRPVQRGRLPTRLASRPGGYVLTATADELDLLQFREHVAAGELAVQAGESGGRRRLPAPGHGALQGTRLS